MSRGFAAYLTKNEAREHFHRAILSCLALITKVKDSGPKKFRIIIDLLRSGAMMVRGCLKGSYCQEFQTSLAHCGSCTDRDRRWTR